MNIVKDEIWDQIDNLIKTFEYEERHCESEWFSSLVSSENLQSDFNNVCEMLINEKRVLPLFLRDAPCVFIFRENNVYFRIRFLQSEDIEINGILILIDFETSIHSYPEIIDEGCDAKFVWSNIVDFCVCAVAGRRDRYQEFPASYFISIREWFQVIGMIQRKLSIIPLKIGTSELAFRSGEMVIYCAYYSAAISDDSVYDDESDYVETMMFIELSAKVSSVSNVGCLE